MRRKVTCSWCHELNEMMPGPASCNKCGHRADVPRMECDCRRCLAVREEARKLLQLAEQAVANRKEV